MYQGNTVISVILLPNKARKMAPCSYNKTPSFIVICPERFFTFVVLYPVVSVSCKPSFFHFVSCFCKNGRLWPPTEKISLPNYRVFENEDGTCFGISLVTNCERTRSCAFAVALIRLFLWTLLRKIQNQHSSCFIFRLEKDAQSHHYHSLERQYNRQKRRALRTRSTKFNSSTFSSKISIDET